MRRVAAATSGCMVYSSGEVQHSMAKVQFCSARARHDKVSRRRSVALHGSKMTHIPSGVWVFFFTSCCGSLVTSVSSGYR